MNDILQRLASAASGLCLDLSLPDLLVVAEAWTLIELDGESETTVVRWAQRELGLSPVNDVVNLHAQGLTVREISAITGVSKSRAHRMLSQASAA